MRNDVGELARIGRLLLKSPPDIDEVQAYSQKQLSKYLLALLMFKHLVALRAASHVHPDDLALANSDAFQAFVGILLAVKCGEDKGKAEKTLDLVQNIVKAQLQDADII